MNLDFDIAKIQKIFESIPFWTTFLWLKNIKSLIIRQLKNRFGKLLYFVVFQNDNCLCIKELCDFCPEMLIIAYPDALVDKPFIYGLSAPHLQKSVLISDFFYSQVLHLLPCRILNI